MKDRHIESDRQTNRQDTFWNCEMSLQVSIKYVIPCYIQGNSQTDKQLKGQQIYAQKLTRQKHRK